MSLSSEVLFSSVYVGVHLAISVSYHMQKGVVMTYVIFVRSYSVMLPVIYVYM